MKPRTILAAALVCVLAFTAAIVHAADALPSGDEGAAKQSIADCVEKVTKQDSQDLKDLNECIGQHEKKGDSKAAEFFSDVLGDDLIFRRATGAIVTKQQFLLDLKPEPFEFVNWVVQEPKIYDDGAVVTVIVEAKRKGEVREKPGQYLNVRRFVKRGGKWQLVAWLNTEMKP